MAAWDGLRPRHQGLAENGLTRTTPHRRVVNRHTLVKVPLAVLSLALQDALERIRVLEQHVARLVEVWTVDAYNFLWVEASHIFLYRDRCGSMTSETEIVLDCPSSRLALDGRGADLSSESQNTIGAAGKMAVTCSQVVVVRGDLQAVCPTATFSEVVHTYVLIAEIPIIAPNIDPR